MTSQTEQLPTESFAEFLRRHPENKVREAIASLPQTEQVELEYSWRELWGRPNQILPGTPRAEIQRDEWDFWLLLAGRGFGKTRTGAETVREWARDPGARILMIAPVSADVREVMIEGPSGLMSCYPESGRPSYNPSRHLVTFPSGAIGITRSADEPERLRGPQFTKFWADELCAWRFVKEAWDQIMFGFRLKTPELRGVITTTPKPIETLKQLIANPGTVITRGSSYDNRANLSSRYYEAVLKPYEGTRLGRQEIYAEVLQDVPGALWTQELIDRFKIGLREIVWDLMVRIVVAIDPAVTAGENSDDTGIIVAGLTDTAHVIIIDDLTCKESPLTWAKAAIDAYKKYRADMIVGETNNGGQLVEANIRAVDPNVPFHGVHASRGKAIRAEPVAALYEQGRVHHIGNFPLLEQQMCSFVPGLSQKSPDRMDAMVWAVTELVIDPAEILVRRPLGERKVISRF